MTHITTSKHSILGNTDLPETVYGGYAADFDTDAVQSDYNAAVAACLPNGWTWTSDDKIVIDTAVYDPDISLSLVDEIDNLLESINDIDLTGILERHKFND